MHLPRRSRFATALFACIGLGPFLPSSTAVEVHGFPNSEIACSDLPRCDSQGCDGIGSVGADDSAAVTRLPQDYLFSQQRLLKTSGWIDTGFVGNFNSPASHFNGPYSAVDQSNKLMANQLYLVNEVKLPSSGNGVGGRVDVLYGEDYLLAQSNGLERHANGSPHWNSEYYGLALPQAYAEFGSQDLSIKAGHFYSIVGYEGVMAPSNFFYSKAYSYQFASPITHWGSLATWRPTNSLQVQAGVTNGWDALDRPTNQVGLLAGVKYTTDDWWSSFAVTTGNENSNIGQQPAINNSFTNRTRASLLAGTNLNADIRYVLHYWLGFQDKGAANGADANWQGIDQYFYYNVNQNWTAAARAEWFHDQDGTRLGLNRTSNPNNPPYRGDVVSFTKGLNYQPNGNWLIRPEVRSDWYRGSHGGPKMYDDGGLNYQFLVGCDLIATF